MSSDEEPDQPPGLLAGGGGQQRAADPQAAAGAGEGDAGERQAAGALRGEAPPTLGPTGSQSDQGIGTVGR